MDARTRLQQEIAVLDRKIDENPTESELYLERGKLSHRSGVFDKALNDFIRVRELEPGHVEAKEYIAMISEIFEFRYKDIYNP